MTERVFMNQDDSKKQLVVKLFKEDDVDFLEFNLGAGKIHKLDISLEDNQASIKSMFCDLIPLLETDALELVLNVGDDYDNNLLKEVSTSYINDLNKEIESVRTDILDRVQADE